MVKNEVYGYNAFSGGFCRFINENKNIIYNENIEGGECSRALQRMPDAIISDLIHGSFIVNKDLDEFALVKSKHFFSRFMNSNSLNLTLIPTRGCNFRCTYCFESDKNYPNDCMELEVMDAVIELIDTKLEENGNLVITWFGGEPLLKIDIIKKMQERMQEIVKRKKLNFYSGIITNGYLLTPKVVEELMEAGVRFSQITVDGTKKAHDKKRVLKDQTGTFERIIKNIKNANEEFQISMRISVDKENIENMREFIEYIALNGFAKRKNIHPYFAIVNDYSTGHGEGSCNCFSIKEFAAEESELNQYAFSKGINITKRINPNIISCGSLSPQSFVVEPNGDLQKCWELVGNSKTKIGNILLLNSQKEYISNQVKWYSWTKFDNVECKTCNILPLCMGGCPQRSLDSDIKSGKKCSPYKYNLIKTLEFIAEKYNGSK